MTLEDLTDYTAFIMFGMDLGPREDPDWKRARELWDSCRNNHGSGGVNHTRELWVSRAAPAMVRAKLPL